MWQVQEISNQLAEVKKCPQKSWHLIPVKMIHWEKDPVLFLNIKWTNTINAKNTLWGPDKKIPHFSL